VSPNFPYFQVLIIETQPNRGYQYQIVTAYPTARNAYLEHTSVGSTLLSSFSGELWTSSTTKFVYVEPSTAQASTQTGEQLPVVSAPTQVCPTQVSCTFSSSPMPKTFSFTLTFDPRLFQGLQEQQNISVSFTSPSTPTTTNNKETTNA
jgi:hypothetical protein